MTGEGGGSVNELSGKGSLTRWTQGVVHYKLVSGFFCPMFQGSKTSERRMKIKPCKRFFFFFKRLVWGYRQQKYVDGAVRKPADNAAGKKKKK